MKKILITTIICIQQLYGIEYISVEKNEINQTVQVELKVTRIKSTPESTKDFDGIKVDGTVVWEKGTYVEISGVGKRKGNNIEFKFSDNFENEGTGTIQRNKLDNEIIELDFNTTKVLEYRAARQLGKYILKEK